MPQNPTRPAGFPREVVFTRALLSKLRQDYANAKAYNQESFEFEGRLMFTAYAKYLIEYLDSQFKR